MTIDSFTRLSLPEQDHAVMKNGVHLLDYHQESVACEVYRLYEFYVKLRFESSKNDSPTICTFANLDDFHLYEHHIFALIAEM